LLEPDEEGETLILCTAHEVTEEQLQKIKKETQEDVVQGKISSLSTDMKHQIEIVLTFGHYHDAISSEDLEQLPNLRWIQVMSSGIEQLPFDAMAKKDLLLTSAKGVHAIPISEYVLGMMLYFAKNIRWYTHLQKKKIWEHAEQISEQMTEISGKTIAILGTGSIGSEIARKTKGLGMRTFGFNRSGHSANGFDRVYPLREIDEVLPACDYVCAALPSTQETKNLIHAKRISLMKDGVVFINVGRGDVIVENDLVEALRMGKIAFAALDVFQEEPLPVNHPFWKIDNLVITPHVSSYTNWYMPRTLDIFFANYRYYQERRFEEMVNRIDYKSLDPSLVEK
jgi:phosphoglycerate dehydrogenase-like enzyme